MKLNVGCGPVLADGWVNADVREWGQEVVADVTALPFADCSFDGAVANHVLQMIPQHCVVEVLSELWRVVRVGGVLRVLVPDLLDAFAQYEQGNVEHFQLGSDVTLDAALCTYLSQNGATRSFYTHGLLCDVLLDAGFGMATTMFPYATLCDDDELCALDSRDDESLIIEATR